MRQQLWPRNTFVDFDKSLGVSILKTRKAPGYSASNPTLLETRPRRGYRFIAPVTVEIILSLTLGKHDNPIIRILLANRGLPRTPVEGIRLAYVHYCDSELPSSVLPEMRVEPKGLRRDHADISRPDHTFCAVIQKTFTAADYWR